MNNENYEKIRLIITEFDTEDVITTSGIPGSTVEDPEGSGSGSGSTTDPLFNYDYFEGRLSQ